MILNGADFTKQSLMDISTVVNPLSQPIENIIDNSMF